MAPSATNDKHKHQDDERNPRVKNRPQNLRIYGNELGIFRKQVLRIVRQYPGVAEQIEDSDDEIYDRVLEEENSYVSWFSIRLTKKGAIGLHFEFGDFGEKP